jgi:predicted nucleotide-binding protein (sugar kinase/HSP70/actin superfamily)
MVRRFNAIEVDRSVRKPRVGVIGEILMNFHPVANGHVEEYLENHGLEVIEATLSDFFRRDYVLDSIKAARRLLPFPRLSTLVGRITSRLFAWSVKRIEREMKKFRFYEGHFDLTDMLKAMDGIIDPVYSTGEGWLMPGEISELAKRGVNSFVIINPFGCIPNHITGRGMIKKLKELHPHIQILSLDYDPDTSFANIENRLQMLIINARELEKGKVANEGRAQQARELLEVAD